MATRLRKTRKNRGSRYCGWGQVAQHRASGHKGGLGVSGQLKHHYSSMLKDNPKHFGHSSTRPPHPNTIHKWINIRDLDHLFMNQQNSADPKTSTDKKIIDLTSLGIQKLLGGGTTKTAYTIKVNQFTTSAKKKVEQAGGEVLQNNG